MQLACLYARPVRVAPIVLALLLVKDWWRPSFELVQQETFAAVGGQANAWADVDGSGYGSQNEMPAYLSISNDRKGKIDD